MREQYEAKCGEADSVRALYASLLEKYHALKLQGATVRPTPIAKAPPLEPEARMMAEADAEYEKNATAALVSQGASELEARTIAKAMRRDLMNLAVTMPGLDA